MRNFLIGLLVGVGITLVVLLTVAILGLDFDSQDALAPCLNEVYEMDFEHEDDRLPYFLECLETY